jgi:hypothetical protein
MKLVIHGRLDGLNDFIRESRRDPRAGNRLKKQNEELVFLAIKQSRLGKVPTPCIMKYKWYEYDRRRDMDNVSSFGRKCIQDALVKAGKLGGDGWAYIRGFSDSFEVDRANPRIEVEFEEVEP